MTRPYTDLTQEEKLTEAVRALLHERNLQRKLREANAQRQESTKARNVAREDWLAAKKVADAALEAAGITISDRKAA